MTTPTTTTPPRLRAYRLSIGNSTHGPIGAELRLLAQNRTKALERFRGLVADVYEPAQGVRIYFNRQAFTPADLSVDDEPGPDVQRPSRRRPRWTFRETGAWLPHGEPGRAIPFYQRLENGRPAGPKLTRRMATAEARRAGAVAEFG